MRRWTAAALLALGIAAGGIAGCGGDDSSEEEVPATPPELGIPHDRNAGGSLGSRDGEDPRTSTDPSVTIETTGADDAGAAPGSSGSGQPAAPAQPSRPPARSDPPPASPQTGGSQAPENGRATPRRGPNPGGADGNDFNDFCNQNPGAC